MTWGTVELEPEATRWLQGLSDEDFGRAAFYIDLLERKGVHLGEPYTRQLRGKLRELRFYIGTAGDAVRVSADHPAHGFQEATQTRAGRDRSSRASHETLHRGSAHGGGRR